MLGQTAKEYHLSIVACCEAGDFSPHGIGRAACIDRARLEACAAGPLRLAPTGASGPAAAAVKAWTSAPTTPVLPTCRYCYANRPPARTAARRAEHAPNSPLLTGVPSPGDTVTDLPACSCRDGQLRLFDHHPAVQQTQGLGRQEQQGRTGWAGPSGR